MRTMPMLITAAIAGTVAGVGLPITAAPTGGSTVRTFTICHTGGGTNCVDGDIAWIGGVKYRVVDTDAPEMHPPRYPSEARLGDRATRRLAELMNAGPFEMATVNRDADRCGRSIWLRAGLLPPASLEKTTGPPLKASESEQQPAAHRSDLLAAA